MSWLLILHDDDDMAELLRGNIARELPQTECIVAQTISAARAALLRLGVANLGLLVTRVSPPADVQAARDVGGAAPTVAGLLADLRAAAAPACPPVVLIVTTNDGPRLAELLTQPRIFTVGIEAADDVLARIARDLVAPLPAPGESQGAGPSAGAVPTPSYSRRVDIDITLSMDGRCSWVIKGCPTHPLEKSGMIDVAPGELARLLQVCQNARQADSAYVGRIGCDLYEYLMAHSLKTDELEHNFRCHLSHDSRLDEARFRFQVDEQTNALLVEALAKPAGVRQPGSFSHWMLQSPIYRKFRGAGEGYALYKDLRSRRNRIDCLVIQGCACGFTSEGPTGKRFDAIPKAERECAWLEYFLTENADAFMLNPPRVLRWQAEAPGEFGELVRRTLRERDWPLVHYVGHSLVSGGNGVMALAGGLRDQIDVQELSRLMAAAHTQFLFLNSCRSADAAFIARLVQLGLPAVMGYAWKVPDEVAHRFAQSYYRNLFESGPSRRFVEYAFMRAKRELHEWGNDRTRDGVDDEPELAERRRIAWLSPMLFIQMHEHEPDRFELAPATPEGTCRSPN